MLENNLQETKKHPINYMKLEDILKETDLIMRENDIIYFCNNIDVIKQFLEQFSGKPHKSRRARDFLLENEEYIDKENFILLLIKNYRDNIQRINEKREKLVREFKKGDLDDLTKVTELYNQHQAQEQRLKKSIELGRGIKSIIPIYYYNREENTFKIEVVDAIEVIDGKKVSNNGNLRRFNKIDEKFKNKDNGLGMEYVIQVILLTDLINVFPNERFGDDIRTMILENEAIKRNILTLEELEELRGDINRYSEIVDNIDYGELLPRIKESLRDYVQYIDLDKLLLISAYRFKQMLEDEKESDYVKHMQVRFLIKGILESIENKDLQMICKLQRKENDEYINEEVFLSVKELEEVLSHFTNKRYVPSKEIEEKREKIKNKEITLFEIEPEDIDVIFSEEELEEVANLSEENFLCICFKYNWNVNEIIDKLQTSTLNSLEIVKGLIKVKILENKDLLKLYELSILSLDYMIDICNEIDISEYVNFETLNKYYNEVQENLEDNEILNKYNRYLELYKQIYIKDKTKVEEHANMIVENVVELYEKEEYDKAIKRYYQDGIITLEALAKWSEEKLIISMYNERILTFEEIEKLNISNVLKQNTIGKNIISNMEKYNQEELLDYINKGYLSEEDIFKIYKSGLLYLTYAEEMLSKGTISVPTYIKIIEREKETLEEQAETKFSNLISIGEINFSINLMDEMEESDIALGDVPLSKKKNALENEESIKNSRYHINVQTTESLIDPNIRWQFLKALKCRTPKDKEFINQNPENPFYNYEFFVIENNDDDARKDSIVIGERFFKDRFTEEEYATSNATYIWKYEDYLTAQIMLKTDQSKNKKAVLQETEGAVYVANHRPGSWAVSLLYKIAQAKAGESFNKYKKGDERATKVIEQLEKLYTQKELMKILDLARIIDDEQKIIMSDGKEVGIVYDVIKESKRIETRKESSHEDDDER